MIVLDASTLISARFNSQGILAQAVGSDTDLLVLHPWRGVSIPRPAEYLAEVSNDP